MSMNKFYLKRFILCGILGWSMECFWTGLASIVFTSNRTFPCQTSMWMFPIYGMAVLILPLSKKLNGKSMIQRGGIYTVLIFLVEFLTGSILKFFDACPWDYSDARLQFMGVIRLDYAPLWFIMGLLFEKILIESEHWEYFQKKQHTTKQ